MRGGEGVEALKTGGERTTGGEQECEQHDGIGMFFGGCAMGVLQYGPFVRLEEMYWNEDGNDRQV